MMSRNGSNNFVNDLNSPGSNFLSNNSSSTTPFTNDSNRNLNTGHEDFNNFGDFNTSGNSNDFNENWNQVNQGATGNIRDAENSIPYIRSMNNFGFIDNNNTDIQSTHSPGNNFMSTADLEDFDKQFIDSLIDENIQINNANNSNNINKDDDSGNPVDININGVPITSGNFSMNTVNNSSTNTEAHSNTAYQSPQPISTSLARDSSSLRTEAFSPQSLGFSTNFTGHKLGKTISNTLAKSYGSQLGTSLNNLISPSSTYEGFLDSPYGSYNDDSLKSPVNSPSFKGIGSPSSVGTHMNPKTALSKENKLSRRRELHNAVERRRRDLIKEKIKELGALIPPSMLYDISKSKSSNKDTKANKNIILNKSVDYILYLKEILEAQDKRLSELEEQVEHLNLNEPTAEADRSYYSKNNLADNYTYDNNSVPSEMGVVTQEGTEEKTDTNADLDSFQKNLKAFTENVDIRPSESKLKFMDFSNVQSEPLDFKKLSESYKKYPRADNMDALLDLEQVNSNDDNTNDNFETGLSFSTKNNGFDNINSIPSPVSNNNRDYQSGEILSPRDDFDRLLNEPGLKFKSDAEFLDQLLSKESVGGFGN